MSGASRPRGTVTFLFSDIEGSAVRTPTFLVRRERPRRSHRTAGSRKYRSDRRAAASCPHAGRKPVLTLDRLDRYGRAWEGLGVDGFVACVTEAAVYGWGPFGDPLRGHDAIRARVEAVVAAQEDVRFWHEPLAVTADGRGVARWGVGLVAAGERFTMEGIFLVRLAPDERCSEFGEWWNTAGEPVSRR